MDTARRGTLCVHWKEINFYEMYIHTDCVNVFDRKTIYNTQYGLMDGFGVAFLGHLLRVMLCGFPLNRVRMQLPPCDKHCDTKTITRAQTGN